MTLENSFGKRVEIGRNKKVTITDTHTGEVTTVVESAAPRKKAEMKTKGFVFPLGTIESIKPLLADVFQVMGEERNETFWLDIEDEAKHTPKEAWQMIKRANKGVRKITFTDVAKAVLETDNVLSQAKSWNRIGPDGVAALESLLAEKISEAVKKPR